MNAHRIYKSWEPWDQSIIWEVDGCDQNYYDLHLNRLKEINPDRRQAKPSWISRRQPISCKY